MNTIVQNILAVAAVLFAVWYLFQRFGILPKPKTSPSSKACGKDDCGCH